jgi:hypothetical protein
MNVADIYAQSIKPLSTADRLQLATLILNDIPPESLIDYRSEWTEEDCRDATRASLSRAEASLGETADG